MPLRFWFPENSGSKYTVIKTENLRSAGAKSVESEGASDAKLRSRNPNPQDAIHLPQASHLQSRNHAGSHINTQSEQSKLANESAVTRSQKMGTTASVEVNSEKTVNEKEPDTHDRDLTCVSQPIKQSRVPPDNDLMSTEQRRAEHPESSVDHFTGAQSKSPKGIEWKNNGNVRLGNRLTSLRRQLTIEKNKNYKTCQQLQSAQDELARSETTIALLKKSLEDCKERIFAMQPAQGMSDSQIIDLYKPMCESIEEWVDLYCGDIVDTVVLMAEAQAHDKLDSWVWSLFCNEDVQNTLDHQSIDKPMLASLVFRILHELILHESCPMPGLDENSKQILNTLTNSIAELQPAKDSESCQMWKMDMHRALRTSQRMTNMEKASVKEATRKILQCLEFVVPKPKQTQEMEDELHRIVSMAADLAKNVRINMAAYSFEEPLVPSSSAEERVIWKNKLKHYSIIDSNTGLPLRTSSKVLASQDGRVGEMLSWIFPSLVRRDIRPEKRTELCKPVIVVKFDHEIPRGGRPKAFV